LGEPTRSLEDLEKYVPAGCTETTEACRVTDEVVLPDASNVIQGRAYRSDSYPIHASGSVALGVEWLAQASSCVAVSGRRKAAREVCCA
jgi:hypothetical protein